MKAHKENHEQLALTTANHLLLSAVNEALDNLHDEHIHYHATVLDERSIRDIAIHAYRPVLASVAVVVGQPWPEPSLPPVSLSELQALICSMHMQVHSWLSQVPNIVLMQPVTLRWGAYATGTEAITGSLTHGFVHTGVILGIRALGGFPRLPEGT